MADELAVRPWRRWFRRRDQRSRLVAAAASLGGARNENQDNYLLLLDGRARRLVDGVVLEHQAPDWPQRRLRVVLFDGMGGHRDGRQIAEAAAQEVAGIEPQASAEQMHTTLTALHRRLLHQFSRAGDERPPGTTLVWAELDCYCGRGWLAHIGDSRAYRYASGRWQALTHDHTLAEYNWRDGELDQQDYRRLLASPGQRIAQALGYGSWGICINDRGIKPYRHSDALRLDGVADLADDKTAHADIKPLALAPGEQLLLASDGLWDGSADGRWRAADSAGCIVPDDDHAAAVARSAIAAGSRDNVTVLLLGWQQGR